MLVLFCILTFSNSSFSSWDESSENLTLFENYYFLNSCIFHKSTMNPFTKVSTFNAILTVVRKNIGLTLKFNLTNRCRKVWKHTHTHNNWLQLLAILKYIFIGKLKQGTRSLPLRDKACVHRLIDISVLAVLLWKYLIYWKKSNGSSPDFFLHFLMDFK